MKFFDKPAIYFIMGSRNSGTRDPFEVLEAALSGGITHFQLREKGDGALKGKALLEFALRCRQLCHNYDVPLIINDHVELACEIDADGIHVGQDDVSALYARDKVGKEKILGVSVHSVKEAQQAILDGADYVGMGPIFGTASKSDAKKPSGVKEILAVKSKFPALPVLGIGGITPENAGPVWESGVSGIAVISTIAEAEDIAGRITALQSSCKEGV